jgi:hypothetical protein
LHIYIYAKENEKDVTYTQQLELIRIYLKMISDDPLSNKVQTQADQSNLERGLVWTQMDNFMDSLIVWLQFIIISKS